MFGKKREPEKVTRIDNPALFAVLDATGALTVNVFPQQIKSAGIAGIMLADIAVHLARALAASKLEASESDALAKIVEMFNAERGAPTDDVVGGLVQ